MSERQPRSQITKYFDLDPITIGEVLETAAVSVGDTPVESSDAAAIQEAEKRCINTSGDETEGGRLGGKAQAAASFNAGAAQNVNKITISDVLLDATSKLPRDKAVTCEDADEVKGAELRARPQAAARPGGVADTMEKAAKMNLDD
ncbi:Late embryoproteinsis abundant protein D-34, putative isoform 2 [Hibiscus syriacus]|uniref:Late embryoproteinsis abundant protein D-34, putative isoform 2 n=1 Tax=Hibiscus syriacus TaxID=106335 RepID=A0A6A2ZME3_HIBSY|nr:late embryogenesis abundant protein 3-like [Hibiscus syriacus]KAE8692075.1 Late embryoproteinsis abundant protein D-34, putative isoform 2 [Hibiscus syriacus]